MDRVPTDRAGLDLAEMLRERVRDVVGYPHAGITFKDITPVLADPHAFEQVVAAMAEPFDGRVDKVAGIEARGFILAAPLALRLGAGFVPLRKAGKLPRPTFAVSYELEYGRATLEVHRDAFGHGDRVLIVDDVLATGGTAVAAVRLVRRADVAVVGFTALLDLGLSPGRQRLEGLDTHVVQTVPTG